MEPKECLKVLLDEGISMEGKYRTLTDYLSWWAMFGSRFGIGKKQGRVEGASQLVKQATQLPNGKERLDDVVRDFADLSRKFKAKRAQQSDVKRETLVGLAPGTPIIISDDLDQEESVFFLELKRTRFLCEFPDGRKFSVPLGAFIEADPNAPVTRLDSSLSAGLDLVRALAGKFSQAASRALLDKGLDAIPALLTELEHALDRIENAPVGLSAGLLGGALGPVRKVNPRDQVLVKRISETVVAIALVRGVGETLEKVGNHPSEKVRAACFAVFRRAKLAEQHRQDLLDSRDGLAARSVEMQTLVAQLLG